jgi:UDP-GlcNAc:undecaprenyl-phosphate GlcNAc-1-phosphate transferase
MSGIDAAAIAFVVAVLSLAALRPLANSLGLVDHPGGRKTHGMPVPVIGGVCMWLGMVIVLPLVDPGIPGLGAFLLASAVLVAVGVADDRFDIRPRYRLLAQGLAATILCVGGGLTAQSLGDILFLGAIPLGPFGLPFTVLVVVAVINAFNMLDGMDGLAAGVALACLVTYVATRLMVGAEPLSGAALVGAAVILGFLIFNLPTQRNRRIRTFMGDAGSTMLGLLVAWVGLSAAHGENAVVAPIVPLWMAALPIFDLFSSFIRRLSKGQSPFTADTDHFHHILRRAGFSDPVILAFMVASALGVGLLGVGLHLAGVPDGVLFFGLIALGFVHYWTVHRAWRLAHWLRVRHLGHS